MRLVGVSREDFAAGERYERANHHDIGRILEEPNRAVTHRHVGTARVVAEDLVVGTGIVAADGRTIRSRATCLPRGRA